MNQVRKKILFTGGSGLLSVNWALIKLEEFDIILGLHNKEIALPGTSSVKLNFDNQDLLFKSISELNPDLVIHTAAIANVEICEYNPLLAEIVNVNYTELISKITKILGIKLIHLSTDHLFNGNESLKSEYDIPEPLNVYAKTKLDAECKVLEFNANALIIRTNFYGWGTKYRQSFSDFIIKSLRNNSSIELFNNVYYTPILINELVKIAHLLIDFGFSGIYNICSDERISKLEFGYRLAKVFNLDSLLIKPIEISKKPNLVKRPFDMSLTNLKIKKDLSIEVLSLDDQLFQLKIDEEVRRKNLNKL